MSRKPACGECCGGAHGLAAGKPASETERDVTAAPERAAHLVELRGVTVRFDGSPILDRVDLSFGRDAFIAIIGPNGGGKSTLLRVILGLITPDEGEVLLWGEPPGGNRHRVGYVPQFASFRQSFPITVEEVVAMGRLYQRSIFARRHPSDREEVELALSRLGLLDKRRRQASSLSGGERQKVLIARALCTRPELLLLDEPTASLDAAAADAVYELLAEVNRDIPVLLISHDLTSISQRVKTVGCLNRRLHYHGTRELTEEMVSATYGCPVDLLAHGLPHRVLQRHPRNGGARQ